MMAIEEPARSAASTLPFLRLAFRPFYLLAAGFGALAVPLWLAVYLGLLQPGRIDVLWHMHEMVFGFACAIVIGFLLTAVRTWTGLATPQGAPLALLSLLWLAGRLAMALCPPWAAMLFDVPLLPIVAVILFRLMRRAGNRRNLPLVGLLGLLSLANAAYHLAVLDLPGWNATLPVQAALLVLIVLSSVMGARVVPMFTTNGAHVIAKGDGRGDLVALAAIACCFVAWTAGAPGSLTALLALVAASAHFWRMRDWRSSATLAHPLLWILHLAYAWIGVGVLLLGLAALGLVAASMALHALALGAMGSLIAGMIARTTRGHTAQPMLAGRIDVAMFACVQGAVLARVAAGLGGSARNTLLVVSAVLWSASFILFIIKFGPALFQPRRDGRDG